MKDVIIHALQDAIKWQESFAGAYGHIKGSPEAREALRQADRYRAELKRRTGTRSLPLEKAAAKAVPMTLAELATQAKINKT